MASWTSSKSTSAQGSALPAITTTQPNLRPSCRRSAKRSTHQQWCQARNTEIQAHSEAEVQKYRNARPMDNDRHSANQQWCQMNDIGTFLSALNLVRRRGLDMSMRHQIFMAYLSGFHHFFTTLKRSTLRPGLLYLTWHGALFYSILAKITDSLLGMMITTSY